MQGNTAPTGAGPSRRFATRLALALAAYLCEGHILLEDVPGVAKTMFARAMALVRYFFADPG